MKRTFGIPLFQEQAMQIAIVAAGFTPGEADKLRRAMATFRRNGTIHTLRERFITGMLKNNYKQEFAERCFRQIEGFGDYGFPGKPRRLVRAARLCLVLDEVPLPRCVPPARLLNSQPMGFYSPAQIVRDAIEHGVEVRSADVNLSDLVHLLEPGFPARERIAKQHREMHDDILSTKAIRLGLKQVIGLKEDYANRIVARRGDGYASIRDLWVRTGVPVATLEKLAEADAFGSMGLSRREALWIVRGLNGVAGAEQLPLFAGSQAYLTPRRQGRPTCPSCPAASRWCTTTGRCRCRSRATRSASSAPSSSGAARSDAPTSSTCPMAASSKPPGWCWCASSRGRRAASSS